MRPVPQRPARYQPFAKRPAPSEAARPTASHRGYGSRWQRFRLSYLADHPLCVPCGIAGKIEAATCIDHTDGKGPNGERGYDPTNLTAMCDSCHGRKTAAHDGAFGRPKANG
jgi:5-methylcytosine-specific restriction protein A